jgi:6-phosphofructokinase
VRGIVNEDFVDLTQETSHNLELVAATPASALGSTRDKPDLKPTARRSSRCCGAPIEHFFYIGGNDSSDTVRIVSEEARKAGLPAALHPHPQDHRQRPGGQRPHAGLPVGGALRGPGLCRRQPRQRRAARRVRGVVMGRHAGFLTAARRWARSSPTTART